MDGCFGAVFHARQSALGHDTAKEETLVADLIKRGPASLENIYNWMDKGVDLVYLKTG